MISFCLSTLTFFGWVFRREEDGGAGEAGTCVCADDRSGIGGVAKLGVANAAGAGEPPKDTQVGVHKIPERGVAPILLAGSGLSSGRAEKEMR